MSFTISGTPQAGDSFELRPSTPDLDVFEVLDKAVLDLRASNRTGTQLAQANADNLRHLDAVLSNVLSARSAAGDVLNQVDAETDRLGNQKLAAQTERSNAEDLDMVQAISDFQNQQTSYDAALKSYAMVQRMSLFQYING
jgi:flagellar hook-associated protein 3 FlgL